MRIDKVAEIENFRFDYGFDYEEMNKILLVVLPKIIIEDIKKYLVDTCCGYTEKMFYDEVLAQVEESYLDDIIDEIEMIKDN